MMRLAAGHPGMAMLLFSCAGIAVIVIASRIYSAVYARAAGTKPVMDAFRHVRHYADKPSPAVLEIRTRDRAVYKRFSLESDSGKARPAAVLAAARQAWFNEACREWLLAAKPEIENHYMKMRHPGRKLCRDYFRRTLYSMPRGATVRVIHVDKNGKPRGKPADYAVSVDEMTAWLARVSPALRPVELLAAMRASGFECSACHSRLDECRDLYAYGPAGGPCSALCKACFDAAPPI